MLDQPFRMLGPDHLGGMFLLTSRVTGVSENDPVGPLLTGHLYLVSIDDDYMITAIHMGCISWFVFAANYPGNLTGQTTQYLRLCVNHYPALLSCGFVDLPGLVTVMIHSINNL